MTSDPAAFAALAKNDAALAALSRNSSAFAALSNNANFRQLAAMPAFGSALQSGNFAKALNAD